MSETTGTPTPAGDTHESITASVEEAAGGAEALAAATGAAMATAAPASEIDQMLKSFADRITALEAAAGKISPALAELQGIALPIVAEIAPEHAAAIARIPALETAINAVLNALGLHFGGKVAGLPTSV